MSDRTYREAAMRRRFGMGAESKAKLDKFNEAQTDWFARCRVCGAELRGTLKELKAHTHGAAGTDKASD